jgi:hypothetical protein
MMVAFLLPADEISKASGLPVPARFVHFFLFAVFSGVYIFERTRIHPDRKADLKVYFHSVVFCLVLGTTTEILQQISGLGRTAEFLDVVYDFLGGLFSAFFLFILHRRGQITSSKD